MLVFLVFFIGIMFMNTEKFGICAPESSICQYKYSGKIGEPIVLLSFSTLPVLFLLLFTKQAVYETWKKFALIFIPITIVWIFTAPSSCGGYLPMCITKELASMFSAGLFFLISLLIIIIKSIKLTEKPEQAEAEKSRQLPWR